MYNNERVILFDENASPYIAHHGIKGQKWGIRRYQNEDGTLTPAGEKRYGTNLDVTDKSRENIARIRLGEARRRYDVAKSNNGGTNYSRIAEMSRRVKSAKRAVSLGKSYDRGAKRVAAGETIYGNLGKVYLAIIAGRVALRALHRYANTQVSSKSFNLNNGAYIDRGNTRELISKYGSIAINTLTTAYTAKKAIDNANIRAYYNVNATSRGSIKSIGSQEYADVVKRRSGKNE